MRAFLLLFTLLFSSFYSNACSCHAYLSFCESRNLLVHDIILYGEIIDTSALNIRIHRFRTLEGQESRDTVKVWNGVAWNCENMKATNIGNPGDTVFVLLERIDSLITSWDVLGDYTNPHYFCRQNTVIVQNDSVRGIVNQTIDNSTLPPKYTFYSDISTRDFIAFFESQAGNCLDIRENTFDYIPLPESNARWTEYGANGHSASCWDKQISITKDTVITGKVFQRLDDFGIAKRINGSICTQVIGSSSRNHGYYRNDSLNRKVYVYYPAYGVYTDSLLYDFNLKLDQTLPTSFINWSIYEKVDSIDFVKLNGRYHRRYFIEYYSSQLYTVIIEGIGSLKGLMYEISPSICCMNQIVCVNVNGVTVYPDSSYACSLLTHVEEAVAGKFNIYPNPSSDIVHIESEETIKDVSLYNLQGQEMPIILKRDQRIQLPEMPGLYLLKTQMKNGEVIIRKIIKN